MKDLRLEMDGVVATLLIDRPQARNALAMQTMRELDEVLGSIQESGARVLVIRGAGDRAFCAGGDLKELEHMRSETDAAELALACDFRVAASHARIGFAQVALGLIPAWGASERLAALVGRGGALYMLLSGATMSVVEAKELGLVEAVYSSGSFDAGVSELAKTIAAAPAPALAGIKAAVNAVRPHHHPELADATISAFAKTWADPAHWEAVARMERQRRNR